MQSILPSSRGLPFSIHFRSLLSELEASAWVSLAVFFLLAALVESGAFALTVEAGLEAERLALPFTGFRTAALARFLGFLPLLPYIDGWRRGCLEFLDGRNLVYWFAPLILLPVLLLVIRLFSRG